MNTYTYMYTVCSFERTPETCSAVRIGVNFTIPGLGAVVRAAAIAHLFLSKFANNTKLTHLNSRSTVVLKSNPY